MYLSILQIDCFGFILNSFTFLNFKNHFLKTFSHCADPLRDRNTSSLAKKSTLSTVVSGMEATLMEASVQLTAALGQLITKVKSWKTITGNDAGHTCPA